jgi:hypothetical protein
MTPAAVSPQTSALGPEAAAAIGSTTNTATNTISSKAVTKAAAEAAAKAAKAVAKAAAKELKREKAVAAKAHAACSSKSKNTLKSDKGKVSQRFVQAAGDDDHYRVQRMILAGQSVNCRIGTVRESSPDIFAEGL